MYYIYEIVGVKIGCTDSLTRRQKDQIKVGELVLLEKYECIYKASEREKDLQIEKGFPVDSNPYWFTVNVMRKKSKTKEALSKLSKSLTGREFSAEHRKKIGDLHRGKTVTEEHKERCRQLNSKEGSYRWNKGARYIDLISGFEGNRTEIIEFTGINGTLNQMVRKNKPITIRNSKKTFHIVKK